MRVISPRGSARIAPRMVALALLAIAGATAISSPAQAWWRGGLWIGVPPVVIAPGYYPPPSYYPPPPYYYAPPPAPYYPPPAPQADNQPPPKGAADKSQSASPVAYGATCYAGVYVCQAKAYTPIGQTCSCPGLGAPSYGTVN